MSEYRPTEYIVDFGDYRSNQFVRLNMALIEQNSAKLGERIVRCKDCKHWQPWMKGVKPECWAYGEPIETKFDGFCAWEKGSNYENLLYSNLRW